MDKFENIDNSIPNAQCIHRKTLVIRWPGIISTENFVFTCIGQ